MFIKFINQNYCMMKKLNHFPKEKLKVDLYQKLKLSFAAILIFLTVFFIKSCEKQIIEKEEINQEENKMGLHTTDGYLVFESIESFINTTDKIANLNNTERAKWERKIGFKSQRRIINTIIEEETKIDQINELKYSKKDFELNEVNKIHSDAYNKYLKKGVIKIIEKGTVDEYWDYAVFNRGFVDFINEDGLFAIGDTLYQATSNALKAMKNVSFKKANRLIAAKEPDEKNNIFFLHHESKLKATSPGLIQSSWVNSGGGKKGEKRIKIGIYLDVKTYLTSNKTYHFYHDVYVQCQERNWLRRWKYKYTEIWVDGSWIIEVYKYPEQYGNSWSYHGHASYLKASINPESGSSAPYQAYFSVSPKNPLNQNLPWYNGDQYNYQPVFNSYNWSALRHGGSSGLRATLMK